MSNPLPPPPPGSKSASAASGRETKNGCDAYVSITEVPRYTNLFNDLKFGEAGLRTSFEVHWLTKVKLTNVTDLDFTSITYPMTKSKWESGVMRSESPHESKVVISPYSYAGACDWTKLNTILCAKKPAVFVLSSSKIYCSRQMLKEARKGLKNCTIPVCITYEELDGTYDEISGHLTRNIRYEHRARGATIGKLNITDEPTFMTTPEVNQPNVFARGISAFSSFFSSGPNKKLYGLQQKLQVALEQVRSDFFLNGKLCIGTIFTEIRAFESYVQRDLFVAYGKELAGVADYLRTLGSENNVDLLLPMVFLTWRLRSVIEPGDFEFVDGKSNLVIRRDLLKLYRETFFQFVKHENVELLSNYIQSVKDLHVVSSYNSQDDRWILSNILKQEFIDTGKKLVDYYAAHLSVPYDRVMLALGLMEYCEKVDGSEKTTSQYSDFSWVWKALYDKNIHDEPENALSSIFQIAVQGHDMFRGKGTSVVTQTLSINIMSGFIKHHEIYIRSFQLLCRIVEMFSLKVTSELLVTEEIFEKVHKRLISALKKAFSSFTTLDDVTSSNIVRIAISLKKILPSHSMEGVLSSIVRKKIDSLLGNNGRDKTQQGLILCGVFQTELKHMTTSMDSQGLLLLIQKIVRHEMSKAFENLRQHGMAPTPKPFNDCLVNGLSLLPPLIRWYFLQNFSREIDITVWAELFTHLYKQSDAQDHPRCKTLFAQFLLRRHLVEKDLNSVKEGDIVEARANKRRDFRYGKVVGFSHSKRSIYLDFDPNKTVPLDHDHVKLHPQTEFLSLPELISMGACLHTSGLFEEIEFAKTIMSVALESDPNNATGLDFLTDSLEDELLPALGKFVPSDEADGRAIFSGQSVMGGAIKSLLEELLRSLKNKERPYSTVLEKMSLANDHALCQLSFVKRVVSSVWISFDPVFLNICNDEGSDSLNLCTIISHMNDPDLHDGWWRRIQQDFRDMVTAIINGDATLALLQHASKKYHVFVQFANLLAEPILLFTKDKVDQDIKEFEDLLSKASTLLSTHDGRINGQNNGEANEETKEETKEDGCQTTSLLAFFFEFAVNLDHEIWTISKTNGMELERNIIFSRGGYFENMDSGDLKQDDGSLVVSSATTLNDTRSVVASLENFITMVTQDTITFHGENVQPFDLLLHIKNSASSLCKKFYQEQCTKLLTSNSTRNVPVSVPEDDESDIDSAEEHDEGNGDDDLSDRRADEDLHTDISWTAIKDFAPDLLGEIHNIVTGNVSFKRTTELADSLSSVEDFYNELEKLQKCPGIVTVLQGNGGDGVGAASSSIIKALFTIAKMKNTFVDVLQFCSHKIEIWSAVLDSSAAAAAQKAKDIADLEETISEMETELDIADRVGANGYQELIAQLNQLKGEEKESGVDAIPSSAQKFFIDAVEETKDEKIAAFTGGRAADLQRRLLDVVRGDQGIERLELFTALSNVKYDNLLEFFKEWSNSDTFREARDRVRVHLLSSQDNFDMEVLNHLEISYKIVSPFLACKSETIPFQYLIQRLIEDWQGPPAIEMLKKAIATNGSLDNVARQLTQIKRWFTSAETEVDIHTQVNDIMSNGQVLLCTDGDDESCKLQVRYRPQNSEEDDEDWPQLSLQDLAEATYKVTFAPKGTSDEELLKTGLGERFKLLIGKFKVMSSLVSQLKDTGHPMFQRVRIKYELSKFRVSDDNDLENAAVFHLDTLLRQWDATLQSNRRAYPLLLLYSVKQINTLSQAIVNDDSLCLESFTLQLCTGKEEQDRLPRAIKEVLRNHELREDIEQWRNSEANDGNNVLHVDGIDQLTADLSQNNSDAAANEVVGKLLKLLSHEMKFIGLIHPDATPEELHPDNHPVPFPPLSSVKHYPKPGQFVYQCLHFDEQQLQAEILWIFDQHRARLRSGPVVTRTKALKLLRGPRIFELLRCQPETSKDEVRLFLSRASHPCFQNPCCFMIVGVNLLQTELQELILTHQHEAVADRNQHDENISHNNNRCLIVIETNKSHLQRMPSVTHEEREPRIFGGAKQIASRLTQTQNGNHVPSHIEFVQVVHGSSGSGKSFYIREEAKKFGCEPFHVPINEEFNESTVIKQLQEIASKSLVYADNEACRYLHVQDQMTGRFYWRNVETGYTTWTRPDDLQEFDDEAPPSETVVWFNITVGTADKNIDSWSKISARVNSFFFDLLVSGCVSAAKGGLLFQLPRNAMWKIYIEAPSGVNKIGNRELRQAGGETKDENSYEEEICKLISKGVDLDNEVRASLDYLADLGFIDVISNIEILQMNGNNPQLAVETILSRNTMADTAESKSDVDVSGPLCLKGHELIKFTVPNDGFSCDECQSAIETQNSAHGCRVCNYDICENCFAARGGSGVNDFRDQVVADCQADDDENFEHFQRACPILQFVGAEHHVTIEEEFLVDPSPVQDEILDTPWSIHDEEFERRTVYQDPNITVHQQVQLVCSFLKELGENGAKKLFERDIMPGNVQPSDKGYQVTFARRKALSQKECNDLLRWHAPTLVFLSKSLLRAWISYMFRRCVALESMPQFQFNQGIGESENLARSMLNGFKEELKLSLNTDCSSNWSFQLQSQIVIGTKNDASVLTLGSEAMWDQAERDKWPWITTWPSSAELTTRKVLDQYLADVIGINLREKDGYRLRAIDEMNYVLTLDYSVKMINIHERKLARVPLIIQGETGVGKTMLVRMLARLWNDHILQDVGVPQSAVPELFQNVAEKMEAELSSVDVVERNDEGVADIEAGRAFLLEISTAASGFQPTSKADLFVDLVQTLCQSYDARLDVELFVKKVAEEIHERISKHPRMIQCPGGHACRCLEGEPQQQQHLFVSDRYDIDVDALGFIRAFECCSIRSTFFKKDIHESLTSKDMDIFFQEVEKTARDLPYHDITVFLDEINTTSVIGVFKEILSDHSICGRALPHNVNVIAACNPVRETVLASQKKRRMWATGEYQVIALPDSMTTWMWDYGSLDESQEMYYITSKLNLMPRLQHMNALKRNELSNLIARSQILMREYAETANKQEDVADAAKRAKSVVSQRDIQRVFQLQDFFFRHFIYRQAMKEAERISASVDIESRASAVLAKAYEMGALRSDAEDICTDLFKRYGSNKIPADFVLSNRGNQDVTHEGGETKAQHGDGEDADSVFRRSTLLALGLVYYSRLGSKEREHYTTTLHQREGPNQRIRFEDVWNKELDLYIKQAYIPRGVAKNMALRENFFAVVVCSINRIPLSIIGPPGVSKTLSFNLAIDNLKGQRSRSTFFQCTRFFPELQRFHYQCSRRSSSLDIERVLQRAVRNQASNDKAGLPFLSVVFMDEAGLPDDDRAPLKVLHPYLDSPSIGFVAISNEPLDAAKTNRMISLKRDRASAEDLRAIAVGTLCTTKDEEILYRAEVERLEALVQSYRSMQSDEARLDKETYEDLRHQHGDEDAMTALYNHHLSSQFSALFGQRDFVHLVRYVVRKLKNNGGTQNVDDSTIIQGLERNFGGMPPAQFQLIVQHFLNSNDGSAPLLEYRNVVDVLRHSIFDSETIRKEVDNARDSQRASSLNESVIRFKLIIDDSEDESISRLLFSNGILDEESTRVLRFSSFSEESENENLEIISEVKAAAASGKCVLLSQTEGLEESFFDLFNQHFTVFPNTKWKEDDPNSGPKYRYFANIAVGSVSKNCPVDPKFMIIVVKRKAELAQTPPAELNRFEKFRIRLVDVYNNMRDGLPGVLSSLIDTAAQAVHENIRHLGPSGTCVVVLVVVVVVFRSFIFLLSHLG